jgi:hypothetical protein
MLERLLVEMRAGGPITPAILARRLNTSVEMVRVMLDKLVQLGLITEYDPDWAGSGCHACSMDSMCKPSSPISGKMWTSFH